MTSKNPRHNASFLVYGPPKYGKSSLAATAPGKKLVLDAEGSWNAFMDRLDPNTEGETYRVTWWSDLAQTPPDMVDHDICVVDVQRWEAVDQVIDWLVSRQHSFDSIIMDSVTEVQNRCKQAITGIEGLQQQDWGRLLAHMTDRVKRFKDIVKDPENPARVAVFTSEGKIQADGRYGPQMEGSLRNGIGYWMNTTACLRVVQIPGPDGIVTDDSPTVRRLLIGPHPSFISGSHFEDRFPANVIERPNITQMMGTIFHGFQP